MNKIERIFVVDDDADIAGLLQTRLQSLGYTVEVHLRAKGAAAVAKTFKAQLVLLDVMLGDGIGYQVARDLRRDPLMYPIPILFESVIGDEHEVEHAYAEGGDSYVTKPYSAQDLMASLNQMERLYEETRRVCPDTGMHSVTYLRREIDHRLFRGESLALSYVHFEVPPRANGRVKPISLKSTSKEIARAIGRTVKNGGFYETKVCHMGGGFFMTMTKLEDHERFSTCLNSELGELVLDSIQGAGEVPEPIELLVQSTSSVEGNFKHATEMFRKLQEPRDRARGHIREKSGPKNFDGWGD